MLSEWGWGQKTWLSLSNVSPFSLMGWSVFTLCFTTEKKLVPLSTS